MLRQVKLVLESRLCTDMSEYIVHILAANSIQRKVRQWMFRHVHTNAWKDLTRLLLANTDPSQLHILQSNAWVRKEWLQEPFSWIHMLTHERASLPLIVKEACIHFSKL